MEKIINLGNREFKYNVNFQLSYNFLKYRNKIQVGFDVTKANRKVMEEIAEMQEKVKEAQKELQDKGEITSSLDFLDNLSPETKEFLNENANQNLAEKFSQEEIYDIVKNLTKLENEEEIEEILNIEVENYGYDALIGKLIGAISEVFMNVKAN